MFVGEIEFRSVNSKRLSPVMELCVTKFTKNIINLAIFLSIFHQFNVHKEVYILWLSIHFTNQKWAKLNKIFNGLYRLYIHIDVCRGTAVAFPVLYLVFWPVGEALPFEPRTVTLRKDKWVTKEYTIGDLLGRYVMISVSSLSSLLYKVAP